MKSPKIFRIIFFSLISIFAFSLFSCNYGFFWGLFGEENVDERSSSISDLNSKKPDLSVQNPQVSSIYSVLVITDLHFGANFGHDKTDDFLTWFENRLEICKLSNPEKIPRFVINLGDTADGGHASEYRDYLLFENKIKALAKKCGIVSESSDYKVYSILGNHDLYNNGISDFRDFCFPYISSYYFSLGGFSYYFLDSANGTLGTSQLEDFKEKASIDPRPKIILTHYPIHAGAGKPGAILMRFQNTQERNTLLSYFAKYNVRQIFDGHIHDRIGFDFGKFSEDVVQSLRWGEALIFTVNENTGTVTTETVRF